MCSGLTLKASEQTGRGVLFSLKYLFSNDGLELQCWSGSTSQTQDALLMRNVSSYGHDGVILAFSVQDVPSCGRDGKCVGVGISRVSFSVT